MDYIYVFTDGSSLNNQSKNSKGGIGVFFKDNDNRNKSIKITPDISKKVTNQIAELLACIYAIETIISTENVKDKSIYIYSDSMYTINSMTKWAKNWEKNEWKKSTGKVIENLELIKKLYFYTINLNVRYKHVKAHKNEPEKDSKQYFYWYGNHMADLLATTAAKS